MVSLAAISPGAGPPWLKQYFLDQTKVRRKLEIRPKTMRGDGEWKATAFTIDKALVTTL
ncbi:hypothetical protein AB4Z52_29840 [Rhizobium sp. 2YAF20]